MLSFEAKVNMLTCNYFRVGPTYLHCTVQLLLVAAVTFVLRMQLSVVARLQTNNLCGLSSDLVATCCGRMCTVALWGLLCIT
jgi:hypothetical protein